MTRQKDPSVRMLRSSFGGQTKSVNTSEPAFGFGTSVRDSGLKVCELSGWRRPAMGRGGAGAAAARVAFAAAGARVARCARRRPA
jgi:hypothetical protein